MKKLLAILLYLLLQIIAHTEAVALTCADLDGAKVFSQENSPVYLGFFGSRYATDSINNPYGTYGSRYQTNSVRNIQGLYGSSYGFYSANNDFSQNPPMIIKCGYIIAYLTTNDFILGGVSLADIDLVCDDFYSLSPSDDLDGDGWSCDLDCDDFNAAIHPGAPELCDGIDNDCNAGTSDGSGDPNLGDPTSCGFGVCENTGEVVCSSGGLVDTCLPGSPLSATDITCDQVDDDCDGFVDEDCSSGHSANIELFLARFYQQCLNRPPDQEGLDYWVNSLVDGSKTGSDVAWGFVFSQEFVDRNTMNDEYLTILYRAFFDRDPGTGELAYWLDQFGNGASREDVLDSFIFAQEFIDLCESYGIIAFRTDPRALVEAFVTRFYQQCLNRTPDPSGLAYWVDSLLDGSLTGTDVAWGFVFSQEFVDLNTTNEEYLTVLYRAFFDREADAGGWNYWLGQLNSGTSREDVLDGFIYAQEFLNLCNDYGIRPF